MSTKRISASVILPLYLGMTPLDAFATGIDGASAGLHTVTGTAWETLESVTVASGSGAAANLVCMVVCSAEAANPFIPNAQMDYRLAVTNNQTVLGGSDRRFQFVDPLLAPIPWPPVMYNVVSTTAAFRLPANASRIISCSARKHELTDPAMAIQDSSMSIACQPLELQNNPALPQVE